MMILSLILLLTYVILLFFIAIIYFNTQKDLKRKSNSVKCNYINLKLIFALLKVNLIDLFKRKGKLRCDGGEIPNHYKDYFSAKLKEFNKFNRIIILPKAWISSDHIVYVDRLNNCYISYYIYDTFSKEELIIVIAHELAHINNGDYWNRFKHSALQAILAIFLLILSAYIINFDNLIALLFLTIFFVLLFLVIQLEKQYYYLIGELRADRYSANHFRNVEVANVLEKIIKVFSSLGEQVNDDSKGIKELWFRITVLQN